MNFSKVSVIVAAYNAESTIAKCIEKILALDYPAYDVIVVDNNSRDNTFNIIKKYPVKYLLETKKGWPAARNTGIAYSKEKFVANIDSDCFPSKGWLKNLMMAVLNDGNAGCVVGKTLVVEGKTLAQRYYSTGNPFGIEHKIGKTKYVPWGGGNNVMVRKVFVEAGGYDSNIFTSGADIEFHLRLEKKIGFKTIYEPKAVIYHEARGSVKEFFSVGARYAHDGFLRSRCEEMKDMQAHYRFYFVRKFCELVLNILGMGYRFIMALIDKDTMFRVASSYFRISILSGNICGYFRGCIKYTLTRLR